MSHSLTQPEEIDYVLRVMAEHDMEGDALLRGSDISQHSHPRDTGSLEASCQAPTTS